MGRIKGLLFALVLLAVAALLGVQQANAARLFGACEIGTGTLKEFAPSTDGFYYKVAYEVYSNAAGASSIVAPVAVELGHNLNLNDTVNLTLNNAQFNPDQTVYYVLIGDNASFSTYPDIQQLAINGDNLTKDTYNVTYNINGHDIGFHIVAITSSTISSPTPNLAFRVDNKTDAAQYDYLYLAQVVDNGSGGYTVKDIGSGININPGLDASCTNNPEVLINFTAPNEAVDSKIFAKILPECGNITVGAGLLNVGAELNTDTDFQTFLGGPKVVNTTEIYTCGAGCGVSGCAACSGTCPTTGGGGTVAGCEQWIVGDNLSCAAITGTVSFTLKSIAPESGISSVEYNGATCTASSDNTQWTCTANGVQLTSGGCLDIKVDGTTSLTPTAWTIENMTVVPDTAASGVINLCYTTAGGDAGAWYGGLEALVPFVKSGDGYETYIKLFNRYDKDAKVFAATFKDGGSGSMMVALKQIATIPAGGSVQITGADIAQDFNLTADEIAYGIPVKFMIMVPSGKGCNGISLTGNNDYIGDSTILNGTACPINPNDPYVEGIVVSVTPQGQRSIPLEFKYFKNGSYVQ